MSAAPDDREWKKGSAELLILSLLEDRSRHGYEIAKLIDSAMGARRPRMTRADLARATGIEQSQVSRMLAPTKPMFVEVVGK
jgi:hypothetical protein